MIKERMLTKIKKTTNWFVLISLVFNATMFSVFAPEAVGASPVVSDVFISEYIEGTSNNKALEIFNGTGSSVDLSAGSYTVEMYFNGSVSPGLAVNLLGSVKANDAFVLANASAGATILAQADQTDNHGWYNGDDAVVLKHNGVVIDSIGQVGVDPGAQWGVDPVSTTDNTLVRKQSVSTGDSSPYDAFDPSVEWDGYAVGTYGYLGLHKAPSIPVLFSPSDTSYTADKSPDFVWNASWDSEGDTISYAMYISGPNGFNESFLAASPYPHTAFPYEGTYTWKVRAFDSSSNSSSYSDAWTFTIDTVKPVISNVYASPESFSPNGDMIKDTTDIYYTVNEDAENIVRIRDLATDELLWASSKQDQAAGIYSVNWDGTVDRNVLGYLNGDKVADNTYMIAVQSTDLAGNVKRDRTQRVEVDTQGPTGTYESVIDATNPTNNNDPLVYGKYHGTVNPTDVFAAPVDGSVATDIVSIKVVFEKLNTEAFEANGLISTSVKYWKPGYVDGNGQYTTHDEDLYTCEGCPVDTSSLKMQRPISAVTTAFLPDGTYSVYVQSFDIAGNVTQENIESAQVIDTTNPGEVKNLVVTGKSDTSVSLKWDAVADAAGYKVYYGVQEGVFTGVKSVGNVTSYTVSGLLANTNYFFKVVAYDAAMNDAEPSNIVSGKTNETPIVLASSTGSVSDSDNQAPEGQIAGATDEKKEEGTTENKDEKKEEDKNNGFNWWWVVLLLFVLGGGYYYYTINPAFFKKFGKGPNPPSGI